MSITLPDTNEYKNRIEIIKDVALQIEKDLNIELPLTLSGNPNTAYNELFEQTKPRIKELANERLFSFKNLLYRIDINEKKLISTFKESAAQDEFEIYTHLIIERELQKVVTRHFFKRTLEE